jgi:hypothetical protein
MSARYCIFIIIRKRWDQLQKSMRPKRIAWFQRSSANQNGSLSKVRERKEVGLVPLPNITPTQKPGRELKLAPGWGEHDRHSLEDSKSAKRLG